MLGRHHLLQIRDSDSEVAEGHVSTNSGAEDTSPSCLWKGPGIVGGKARFGTPLEEHLKRSGREIALPIEACVMLLLETGMKEEGLFRIGAGASKLKKLKAALDCSTSHLDEFYSDPHAVAGALKSYLRELPEPLMTFNLYEEWTQVASVQDQDKKLQDLWRTCQKLPPQNFVNFRYLIKFLAKLAQTSDINKMTPSNIAIVLGPNLLWAKNEGTLAEMAAATSVHVVAVIEPIIQHANWFFPEEVEFNVSEAFVPIATPNSNHSSHTGNDCDSGTLERKRPASMAVMEGDLVKKERCVDCFFSLCSFGVKLMDFQAPRRGGTLNRKHVSPAFQPPLPPTDGSTLAPAGPEPPPQSSRAESSTGGGTGPSSAGTLEQGPSPGDGRSLGYPHPLAFSLVGALIHENKVENVMIGFLKRLFFPQSPRTLHPHLPLHQGEAAVRRPPAKTRPQQLPAPISSRSAWRTIPLAQALTLCAERVDITFCFYQKHFELQCSEFKRYNVVDAQAPRAASWALPRIDTVSPRVFVQTPILGFQNRFAASFLKCIQTQPAKTCPAAFCWIWTMTQKVPPCEESCPRP
ncbi:Rho GTPase-activating protein 17 [Camelus dromedarius]|uniref:Rho GTPase-activating protein 17 n=1 Tax=Camelus dromedarius TaxID=9838 RepID=A0A5N4CVS5_CAMDR|nr:Rho GTPase-activating protein 17 [Camelus dromedarius]